MSIIIKCTACQKRMKAPDRLAGKRVKCKCGAAIAIPAATAVEPEEIADLALLAQGESIDGPNCPSCAAVLSLGAVVCVRCGYNLKTGKKMVTAADAAPATPPSTSATASNAVKRTKPTESNREPSSWASLAPIMIKWAFILGALGGLVVFGLYMKDAVSFDPTQQAKDDEAKLSPGMTVQQVVDALGRGPKKIECWQDPPASHGPDAKLIRRTPVYTDDFMNTADKELLKHEFAFIYSYSQRDQLVIEFGPDGKMYAASRVDPLAVLNL